MIRKVEKRHSDESDNSATGSILVVDASRTNGGLEQDCKPKIRRQKTDLEISASLHNLDEASRVECQICLCDFQLGDKICWSNNPQCVHAFHIDCLEPWLMKHNHCPLCRNDYLVPPKMDPELHEVEPTGATTEVRHEHNYVRIRGILGDVILPFFHHSTNPQDVHRHTERNSTRPSVSSTNNVVVAGESTVDESQLSFETNPQIHSLHSQRHDDMDCFDVETGESLAQ